MLIWITFMYGSYHHISVSYTWTWYAIWQVNSILIILKTKTKIINGKNQCCNLICDLVLFNVQHTTIILQYKALCGQMINIIFVSGFAKPSEVNFCISDCFLIWVEYIPRNMLTIPLLIFRDYVIFRFTGFLHGHWGNFTTTQCEWRICVNINAYTPKDNITLTKQSKSVCIFCGICCIF